MAAAIGGWVLGPAVAAAIGGRVPGAAAGGHGDRRPGAGRIGGVAGLALLLAMATATSAGALVLRDMRGREIVLPRPPQRIVSLVPSATEMIFALGGEGRLVGVSDFCDWPPGARRKPRVGGMLAPSLEAIVALRPDLVLATDSGNRQETFAQLQGLHIPVYLVHAARLGAMMDVTARLGTLTGREAAVGPLVSRLQQRIAAVREAVGSRPRPRVVYVLWPEPLIVPGREALVSELIDVAGGESISAAEPGDYPRFSLEAAVARGPEVIVLARHGVSSIPIGRERWERLTSLPAVRAGRLYSVDGDIFHRYGPRIVDALDQLARMFHPEAFR